jgi:choline dehydrogenase-like flavoprotein
MSSCVVGSGPAGVAAAAALLDRGESVTLLDAGGELEPAVQAIVDRLSAEPHEAWSAAALERLKGGLRYNAEGAPLKLAFGSDYPYRDVEALQPAATHGVDAYRALAAGGLSQLWGASILPYADADFEGWPVTADEMRPYYVSVLGMTGLAGEEDALSRLHPVYVRPTTLAPGAQARFVLEHAARHAADLERRHVYVGRARLAVVQPNASGQSCVYCGMCLYGCPYGLIYSAKSTLATRLTPCDRFEYVAGVVVHRVSEQADRVIIDAVARGSDEPRRFEARRVYLAAGVFGSTAILLASLPDPPRPVLLRQSDHFLLPLLLRGFTGRVASERLHTLSQVFVEILDRSLSPHGVHLQLYTYNDLYPRVARDRLGPLYPLVAPLVDRLIDRLVMVKGYLHSDDSAAIRASLDRRSGRPVLRLEAVPSRRSRRVIRGAAALVRRSRACLGARPIRLGLRVGRPGSGAHVGGSFPMRRRPAELESDLLGRPVGFERVHVVDATVFPTLPAAPPTLTIMANAFRIASESAAERSVL